ncbi:MAG: radical SAM family heme chaperone HemW [Candidatus Faecivicinus sp.]
MKPLALYVHIPFCRSKCVYCDFASYPGRESCMGEYLDALIEELRGWRGALSGHEVRTVFIGGGTPSLLDGESVARLMDGVRSCVRVCEGAEITMEANPGTLDARRLAAYRGAGINRLSLGAQSMDDGLLRRLGRIHTADEVREAVDMAREAGFRNLSLDLMYGLPGQTQGAWLETLEAAIRLEPEHLSAYSLIVEEGTPLFDRVRRGAVSVPGDDDVIEFQRAALDRLEAAGYHRYEISNFARPGFECRHNIVYWLRGEYLGVGCAAHSLLDGVRFENPRDLDEYLAGVRRKEQVRLTARDEMEEALMLSTRMVRGMDLAEYRRAFGVDFERAHEKTLARLAGLGLVKIEDGFLRLTRSGLELQNAVVVELLEAE